MTTKYLTRYTVTAVSANAQNLITLRHCQRLTRFRAMTAIVGAMLILVLAAGTALAQKTLLVMENPGNFSHLVETKTIDEPEDSLFSFQNELSNVVGARWQLSSRPIPSNDLSSSGFLGSGAFQPPAQGKGKIISANWKNLVPAHPLAGTKYYFRVVSYQGANTNPILASNTVVVTVKKSTAPPITFTPKGLNPNCQTEGTRIVCGFANAHQS